MRPTPHNLFSPTPAQDACNVEHHCRPTHPHCTDSSLPQLPCPNPNQIARHQRRDTTTRHYSSTFAPVTATGTVNTPHSAHAQPEPPRRQPHPEERSSTKKRRTGPELPPTLLCQQRKQRPKPHTSTPSPSPIHSPNNAPANLSDNHFPPRVSPSNNTGALP